MNQQTNPNEINEQAVPQILAGLELALGYQFEDKTLLKEALTHSSAAQETIDFESEPLPCNERLEFLGDAVLGLVVANELINRPQEFAEGEMSRFRAGVVQEAALAAIAEGIGLGDALQLGRGEDSSGGREKPSVLADALEAVVGAIFRDGGYGAVEPVVKKLMADRLHGDLRKVLKKDFKSALQEYTQSHRHGVPEYEVVSREGPPHDPQFDVAVKVAGKVLGKGKGNSKKRASQDAAEIALAKLRESTDG